MFSLIQTLRLYRPASMILGSLVTGAVLLGGSAAFLSRQDPETDMTRRDFMRTKLMYSQNILEGISTRNFDLIRQGTAEIRRVTEAAEWLVADTPEYRHLSDDLRAILDRIDRAAEQKQLDAVAFRYFNMVTNCIDCHEYSRGRRID